MNEALALILAAIWFFLPAYGANIAPAFLSKVKGIHQYPVDLGLKIKGIRILGEGKTWVGIFLGLIIGTVIGYFQGVTYLGFYLALGALLGDLGGSFIKRRVGMERGKPAPFLDQLDFVIGAFILSAMIVPINWVYFFIIIIITPAFHLGTNYLGYKLKIKNEPW